MSEFLAKRESAPGQLRRALSSKTLIMAPGAYDCVSARLIEEAGFPAVYMTGFGTSAALLGRPDVGLLTMTEMVEQAGRIAACVGIPVIADADTGYGGPLGVIRTVQEYERAGVAAIHIEDQASPKRCGHLEGKRLIPAEEMAAKVRAAVAARQNTDFVVIARTDARAVEGMRSALDRAEAYKDAGADVLFVEAPESEEEISEIAQRFAGFPLLFNWADGGKTPPVQREQLERLGFRIAIYPVSALLTATLSIRELLAQLKEAGSPAGAKRRMLPFRDFLEFIGLPEAFDLEERFGPSEVSVSP